jgi:hypothetical protein
MGKITENPKLKQAFMVRSAQRVSNHEGASQLCAQSFVVRDRLSGLLTMKDFLPLIRRSQ